MMRDVAEVTVLFTEMAHARVVLDTDYRRSSHEPRIDLSH